MRYALLALLWLLLPMSLAVGAVLVLAAKKSLHPLTAVQRVYLALAVVPMFVSLLVPALMTLIFGWDIHKNNLFSRIGGGMGLFLFAAGIVLVIQSEFRQQRRHSLLLGTATLVAASPLVAWLLAAALWRIG
jgi:hypothetical protein